MKAIINRKPTKEEKELVAAVMRQVEGQVQAEQNKAIYRTVKIACLILNEDFGFGAQRISKFFDEITKRGRQAIDNPEGWYRVDEKLKKIGLVFDDEDIAEREAHSRSFYHERGRKFREY